MVALQAPIGQAIQAIARHFWEAPEVCLREAGWRNEVVVAQIRLGLLAVLCVVPIGQLLTRPGAIDTWFGLTLALAALAVGVAVHVAARQGSPRSRLGLVSSLLDVTLVSAGLAFFLLLDRPLTATNSLVIFPIYFLAIASTSLRFDPRTCLVAGAAACLEYGSIFAWAAHMGAGDSVRYAEQIAAYGGFDLRAQLGRLLLLAVAALVAATSVVRSRELLSRSVRDPLTGLLNRAAFREVLRVELARARRNGGGLGVGLLDLDFFKRVNEVYGHRGGDRALVRFAELLRERFRELDVVARLGGDEFMLVLPASSIGATMARLEELRQTLERTDVPGCPGLRLTVSGGVAGYPDDGEEAEGLLETADARLYHAKQSGRNRTVMATGPTTAVIHLEAAVEIAPKG